MSINYYVKIKSEKMTQDMANQIFNLITNKSHIRNFNYYPGFLNLIIEGLPEELAEFLVENKFTKKEVLTKTSDELLYEAMQRIKDLEKENE